MIRLLRFRTPSVPCLMVLAVVLFHAPAMAEVPESVQTAEDGFVSMFNGNDLQGWQGATDGYEVVQGVLRCKPDAGGNLLSSKQYANFIFRFEFRLPQGGNNGLAIRAPLEGNPAYAAMCELQILDNSDPKYQSLDDRQFHGSAYGMVAARKGALSPTGQWNSQIVTVVGSTIRVQLNGQVILDADLSAVTNYLDDKEHPGKNRTEGYLGFAGHGDPVEFRQLWIKELPQTFDDQNAVE